MDHLDTIQKRALKCIDYNTHWDMSSERLHDLNGLEELMDREGNIILTLMFRLSKQMDSIKFERPRITLRSKFKIKFNLPYTRLTMFKTSHTIKEYISGIYWQSVCSVPQQRSSLKK